MSMDVLEDTERKPGLYAGVPADEYRAWPYAAQSTLKILRDQSPAHAYEAMTNPAPPTPALRLGTAVHTAVLQPELFGDLYAFAPSVDRRTKAGREVWEQFEDDIGDRTILKAEEWATCLHIRDSVAAHPTARKLLVGDAEQSAVWKDPDTGVMCKGRFDKISDVGALTDLKTTTDASPEAFTRAIAKYFYYGQAAHYLSGAQVLGLDAKFFTIIAVEKEPPYCVAVYHIKDDAVRAGEDELKPLIDLYARCQETGVWPGYPNEALEIDLPPWAYYRIDERTGG